MLNIEKDREIDDQKDEFLSFASHELKTPITTLNALIQLVEAKIKKKEYKDLLIYTEKMQNQIKRQVDLIENLLDLSRIRTGKITYKFSDIYITKFVRDVVEEFNLNHPNHEVNIESKTRLHIQGDKYRLSQVILNLLNNAVKYAPDSKKINLKIQNQAMMVTIAVQDFGIGIPKQKIDTIFKRFARIEQKFEPTSGLGLGLYIAYEIIKRHKGRLWVESEVKKGSTFYFSLPKDK